MKCFFSRQTERAVSHSPPSAHTVRKELILSLCQIKRACASANRRAGHLDAARSHAITHACKQLEKGKYSDQFPVSFLQGGAGTSLHMNVNEVIAGLAQQYCERIGKKIPIHPNDHVNCSQSTNDVVPSAMRITTLRLLVDVFSSIDRLSRAYQEKAQEFRSVRKLGRTHLQDAVPMTFGEEFSAAFHILQSGKKRLKFSSQALYHLNLGGTAIGTCINASPAYRMHVYRELGQIVAFPLRPAEDFFASTSSLSDFLSVSHAMLSLVVDVSKLAADLRLLSSGPAGGIDEVRLKELQQGSSIMPGKVNPVIPELMNQLYFVVSGNTLAIEHATAWGQLQLNVMFPVVCDRLIEALLLTRDAFVIFADFCISPLVIDQERCAIHLSRSSALATLLSPVFGYDTVSRLVKTSLATGKDLRQTVIDMKLLTPDAFDALVRAGDSDHE